MAVTSGQSDGEPADQRRVLQAVKLKALASGYAGIEPVIDREPEAGLLVLEDRMFGLAETVPDLGRLLHQTARARSAGTGHGSALTIFAEAAVASTLARRASLLQPELAELSLEVLQVQGAQAVPVAPTDIVAPPIPGPEQWQRASIMADAGARVIDDNGRLVADVMGLEVARLSPDGIQVGVGEADRELQGYLNGHLEEVEALAQAVETVRSLRPVSSHPLNRLSRPRWLRSVLLDQPSLVDLPSLEPLPPLVAAEGVFDREPAGAYCPPVPGAVGITVVCSIGVDLNLIPDAFDYRQRTDPESRLILVVPERDRALAIEPLLALFADPSLLEVRSIQPPWESVRS